MLNRRCCREPFTQQLAAAVLTSEFVVAEDVGAQGAQADGLLIPHSTFHFWILKLKKS